MEEEGEVLRSLLQKSQGSEHWELLGDAFLEALSESLSDTLLLAAGTFQASSGGHQFEDLLDAVEQLPNGARPLARSLELLDSPLDSQAAASCGGDLTRALAAGMAGNILQSLSHGGPLETAVAAVSRALPHAFQEAGDGCLPPRVWSALQMSTHQQAEYQAEDFCECLKEAYKSQVPAALERGLEAVPRSWPEAGFQKLIALARAPQSRASDLRPAVAEPLRGMPKTTAAPAKVFGAALHGVLKERTPTEQLLQRLRTPRDELLNSCAALKKSMEGTSGLLERTSTSALLVERLVAQEPGATGAGAAATAATGSASSSGAREPPLPPTPATQPQAAPAAARRRSSESPPAEPDLGPHQGSSGRRECAAAPPTSKDSLFGDSPHEPAMVVINCANLGFTYARHESRHDEREGHHDGFNWEGVREAFRFYDDYGVRSQGVCQRRTAEITPVPADLKSRIVVCPLDDEQGSDVDDLYTIRIAMHYGCQFVDNDNYRDWKHNPDKSCGLVQEWLSRGAGSKLKVTYIFDRFGRFIPSALPPVPSAS